MRHLIKSKYFHVEGWGILAWAAVVLAIAWLNHEVLLYYIETQFSLIAR